MRRFLAAIFGHSSFFILHSVFFIHLEVALLALCGSLVGALGSHCRRIVDALGWLYRRNPLAINRPWGGPGVALAVLAGFAPPFCILHSAFILIVRGPAEAGGGPERLNLKTAVETTKETKDTK